MDRPDRRGEWTVVVALLGAVLFSQPLLGAFDAGAEDMVFGVPILILYLFAAWAGLIALLALVMETFEKDVPKPPAATGTGAAHRDGPEAR